MRTYKCALLVAPGANCYRESRTAVEVVGFDCRDVHINDLLKREDNINRYDSLFIIGGFSFGDYIRAGGIEGALIRKKLADDFRRFYDDGKIILAVCNGLQIVAQAGLLTSRGLFEERDVTLYYNDCGDFRDMPVHLRNVNRGRCIFTRGMDDVIRLPMRNGQGKIITDGFYHGDRTVLDRLVANDQVVFTYVDPEGTALDPEGDYRRTWDPTGSVYHIAGICDRDKGTCLGMMPHPEAAIDPYTDPLWTDEAGPKKKGDGIKIFVNGMDYCRANL